MSYGSNIHPTGPTHNCIHEATTDKIMNKNYYSKNDGGGDYHSEQGFG
jgi:hypothetical protein